MLYILIREQSDTYNPGNNLYGVYTSEAEAFKNLTKTFKSWRDDITFKEVAINDPTEAAIKHWEIYMDGWWLYEHAWLVPIEVNTMLTYDQNYHFH